MASFTSKWLVIVSLVCVLQETLGADVEHEYNWGDTSGGGFIFEKSNRKIAIPFLRRTFEINFPDVS